MDNTSIFAPRSQRETREPDQAGGPTDIVWLERGIHARVGDEPVRLIAFGNVPGHSPAYLCSDLSGRTGFISLLDVRITDPNFLPMKTVPAAV